MTDIASLGLSIDSSQAAAASSNLDAMAGAAGRAEGAAKRVESAAAKLAQTNKVASVNTANLAAQFQDVIVTLQSGQSPMQVALQQGSQIAMAFGNAGAAGAARGLGAAFLSLVSPVSLLSVGIVALTGYAIQWATSSASQTDRATEALKSHDAVLKAIKDRYPQITVNSNGYVASVERLGLVETRNAETLQKSADAALNDLKAQADRVNTLVSASSGLRGKIASPEDVKAFNDLQSATQSFLDSVASGKPQTDAFAKAISLIGQSSANAEVQSIARALSDAADAATKAAHNVESTGDAVDALNGKISAGIPDVRAYASALDSLTGKSSDALTARLAAAQKRISDLSAAKNTDDVDRANKAYEASIRQIDTEKKLEEAARNRAIAMKNASSIGEQEDAEVVYKERLKQIELEKKIEEAASSAGSIIKNVNSSSRDYESEQQKYDRLVASANARVASLVAEQQALGLTAEEAARLQYTQDLLNRAQVSGLTLTPKQTDELKALAAQMAATDAANQKMQENWDAAKGAAKGFISDFVSGLRNGEKAWKSFGDAANGVLDKIINKATDSAIDLLFTNSSSGGGGFGGLLSSLFKFNALGGVYGSQGAMAFANGGAFTNSIVSKPTLFPFANGTGLMGERGPEAIMPLARDSAGRLGVKSSGGGGVTNVSIAGAVVNIAGNADAGTAAQVKQTLDQYNRELPVRVVAAVRDAQARGKL